MRPFSSGILWMLAGGILAPPQALPAAQLDQDGITDLYVTALRYLTEVQLNSRWSNPLLTTLGATDEVRAQLAFDPADLLPSVSRELGVPIMNRDEDRFCDITLPRPQWRLKNADATMSAFLAEVTEDDARVSLGYSGGTLLSGSSHRTLRLVYSSEGWVAEGMDDSVLHGSNVGCRPAPPSSLTNDDLAQMLAATILPFVESPPDPQSDGSIRQICLDDIFDGWTKGVLPLLSEELGNRGFPTGERCMAQRVLDEAGNEAPAGSFGADIHLFHVVFESPDQALVQLAVAVTGPSALAEPETQGGMQQCMVQRTAEGWARTSCEQVEVSMRYPGTSSGR